MAEEEVVILEASALDENFAPMQDEGALEEAAEEITAATKKPNTQLIHKLK